MELTAKRKWYIDTLTHYELLRKVRFAPAGDEWMQGETGDYWLQRLAEKKAEDPAQAVADSKRLGW